MDRSGTRKWQRANERFHRLMRATPELDEHCRALREHIKRDGGVDQWVHLTATRISAFCAWLEDYDDVTRERRVVERLVNETRRQR